MITAENLRNYYKHGNTEESEKIFKNEILPIFRKYPKTFLSLVDIQRELVDGTGFPIYTAAKLAYILSNCDCSRSYIELHYDFTEKGFEKVDKDVMYIVKFENHMHYCFIEAGEGDYEKLADEEDDEWDEEGDDDDEWDEEDEEEDEE